MPEDPEDITPWMEAALWLRQLREESGRRKRERKPLKWHEIFICALLGVFPAGVALPFLTFGEQFRLVLEFRTATPDISSPFWQVVVILTVYVLSIPILICWRGRSSSPVRMFLSGLLLACFTWTFIELTFMRNP